MPGQVQVAGEFQHVDAEAEHVTSLGESPLESLGCKVPDSVINDYDTFWINLF